MKPTILTICLISIISLNACVYAPMPKLPEFKPAAISEKPDYTARKPAECPKAESPPCPVVALPGKMPKNARLEIVNGKVVNADQGGRAIVRQYIGVYDAINAQWSALPP